VSGTTFANYIRHVHDTTVAPAPMETPAMRTPRLALVAVLISISAVAAFGQEVTVDATGSGVSLDAAKNDAMRKAIEQGCGVFIQSKSRTENFVLIEDQIYAESRGFITGMQVLSQTFDNRMGLHAVTIRATVSKAQLENKFAQYELLMQRIGRPRVMFLVQTYRNNQLLDNEECLREFRKHFGNAALHITDHRGLMRELGLQTTTARLADDINKIVALSKERGTDILIEGKIVCSESVKPTPPGMPPRREYSWNINLAVWRISDSKVLVDYNENMITSRMDENSDNGFSGGIVQVGEHFARILRRDMMRVWAFEAQNTTVLNLVIKNTNYSNARKVLEWLTTQEWCSSATRDRFDGETQTAYLRIDSKLPRPEDVADRIDAANLGIEITNLNKTTIEATQR
jgi:hypothetical protein